MLTDYYIVALLADEQTADEVYETWAAGEISDDLAAWAWWLIAAQTSQKRPNTHEMLDFDAAYVPVENRRWRPHKH